MGAKSFISKMTIFDTVLIVLLVSSVVRDPGLLVERVSQVGLQPSLSRLHWHACSFTVSTLHYGEILAIRV